ncbi:MAG: DNA primase [Candidatus Aureabacteria bacterium]|nr:DNA primase [Candidatus Auribacterota bacterium]
MSSRILNDSLKEQVAEANDIVEVISEYIPLKKAGKNYKARCPFHSEKTPSFFVNREKQLFHCFGCKASGDVFSFVMKYESVDFFSALKRLAERVNIPVVIDSDKGADGEKERLYKLNEEVSRYYHQILIEPTSAPLRDYLYKRGIDDEQIRLFKIGYAPDSWDALQRWAKTRPLSQEDMAALGLIVKRDSQKGYYDRFRKRIMIPIENITGKISGFGGRVTDNASVKYMNSPESPIFNKGNILFGLFHSRDCIAKEDSAVIVEGYFDFFSLFSRGVKNVVASLGTSFTENQIKTIKRYTDNIVMAYDSDTAGQKASLRALEVFLSNDMYVKVMILPAGEDPDSFIRKNGEEKLRERLDSAVDILDFNYGLLTGENDISRDEGRVRVAKSIIEAIKKVPSAIRRDIYIKKFAEKLMVDEHFFREEMQKFPNEYSEDEDAFEESDMVSAEEMLLYTALEDLECAKILAENDINGLFSSREQLELAGQIVSDYRKGRKLAGSRIKGDNREKLIKTAAGILMRGSFHSMDKLRAAKDCLRRIRSESIKKRISDIQLQIKAAERRGESDKVQNLLKLIQDLKKSMNSLIQKSE